MMITAKAKANSGVLNWACMAYDNFLKEYGKKPAGFLFGAQDYLEFVAEFANNMKYHPDYIKYETSFMGLPVYISTVTRRREIIINPEDAIYFTRFLVKGEQK